MCERRAQLVQGQFLYASQALEGYGGLIGSQPAFDTGQLLDQTTIPFTALTLARFAYASNARNTLALVAYTPYLTDEYRQNWERKFNCTVSVRGILSFVACTL